MHSGYKYFGLMAAGVLFAGMTAGCGQQAPVAAGPATVVEVNHNHSWDEHETPWYARWESENNRPHQEYANRPANEQSSYWLWRENHHD